MGESVERARFPSFPTAQQPANNWRRDSRAPATTTARIALCCRRRRAAATALIPTDGALPPADVANEAGFFARRRVYLRFTAFSPLLPRGATMAADPVVRAASPFNHRRLRARGACLVADQSASWSFVMISEPGRRWSSNERRQSFLTPPSRSVNLFPFPFPSPFSSSSSYALCYDDTAAHPPLTAATDRPIHK